MLCIGKSFVMKALIFICTLLLPFSLMSQELWVTNYFGDSIRRYDANNGSFIGTAGKGKLDGPLGLALGPDSSVYVTSELTGSIEKFQSTGGWSSRFSTAVTPTSIAFDSTGNSYVSQFESDSVTKYDSSGTLVGEFISSGSGGLNGPDLGAVFGPDGNFYVPSFYSNEVLKYDGKTGAFISKFITGISQPRQILWKDGKVYVSSDNGNKVMRYDAITGATIDTFVTSGLGGLNGAVGMAFYQDSLYVASSRNNRILKYNATTGAFQGSLITSGLNGPVGILIVPEPGTCVTILGCIAVMAKQKLRSKR